MPERLDLMRWSLRLGAVPVAGFRSSRRHVESTVGSRARLVVLLGVVLAATIAANMAAFGFYDSILGSLFDPDGPFGERQRAALTAIFVSSSCIVSSAIALLIAMIVPPHSRIALSARIAGASRSLIAVGEFLPTAALIAIVVIASSGASTAVIASHQQFPVITTVSLVAIASAFGIVALIVRDAVVIGAGLLKWSDTASRSVGMLVAILVTGAMIVDIGTGALQQRTSVVARCLVWLWSGRSAPTTFVDAAASIAVLLALVALACLTAAGGGLQQPLQVGWRVLAARAVGRPSAFINFVIREALLYIRHPVTAVSLISMAVLMAAGVAAARTGLIPAEAIVIFFAILCAAGAETAHGRTRRVR
ncbi:MAG TPA: hypothetical protein VNT53_09140 [Pseudolysinimonas sp.]|nr:hypothetical protein [Pseudolysinimonas sp.]